MDVVSTIESTNLDLVLLDLEALETLSKGAPPMLVTSGQFQDPSSVLRGDRFLCDLRAGQIAADQAIASWLLRYIIERSTMTIVGSVNFHGAPDERAMVEIGLTIAEPFRRRGIARETVSAMAAFAGAHGAHVLRATIEPANRASLALFTGLGLLHVGEQIDEIDGLELIYESALPLAVGDVTMRQ